jgi:hypothetical protein
MMKDGMNDIVFTTEKKNWWITPEELKLWYSPEIQELLLQHEYMLAYGTTKPL